MTYFKRDGRYLGSIDGEKLVVLQGDKPPRKFINNCHHGGGGDVHAAMKKLMELLDISDFNEIDTVHS